MKAMLNAAALGLATLALSACSETAEQTEQAPDAVAGLVVENARVVLPAVTGNPAAVYFDATYSGGTDAELAGLFVAGAEETMMHEMKMDGGVMSMGPIEKVALPNGAKVSFAPGGNHGMAMKVSDELKAGGTTELTLIMASGDKTTVNAEIRGAGEDR